MDNQTNEIDQWLIDPTLEESQLASPDLWLTNFDVERQVVFSKFGPYNKLFLRPKDFVKRFYHTVYPLLIEDWPLNEEFQFFDGFCTINLQLDIRFQATFKYAQSQLEILSEINEYIKNTYYSAILKLVKNELLSLQDDSWVRNGLGDIEKSIALVVSEMLVLENIQSQSVCTIYASFAEFPDVRPGKNHLYLSVLKQSYEVTEEKRDEQFRQQRLEDQQKWSYQQIQFEDFEQYAELEREKQIKDAEHQKQLLLNQELQLQEQLEIQERMQVERFQHENRLKELSLGLELQQKQQQSEQLRITEQQAHTEDLAHKALLKDQEVQSEIEKYAHKQVSWLTAKAKKTELRIQHEHQQEQLIFEMNAAKEKRQEERRMEIQEQNYEMTKNSDIYLRREIELLELDRKRLELHLENLAAKKNSER